MKKILVLTLIFTILVGSFSFVGATNVLSYKDMDSEEIKEMFGLYGDNYLYYANAYLNSPRSIRKTIHQAIAHDYGNGEDFKIMMERYGLDTVDFAIDLLEPYKTIEEAIKYDWDNGENIEVMKERYGLDESYISWNLEKSTKEPSINPKEIINDWLNGKDYNELKEKYKFTDKWFMEGIKNY